MIFLRMIAIYSSHKGVLLITLFSPVIKTKYITLYDM